MRCDAACYCPASVAGSVAVEPCSRLPQISGADDILYSRVLYSVILMRISSGSRPAPASVLGNREGSSRGTLSFSSLSRHLLEAFSV